MTEVEVHMAWYILSCDVCRSLCHNPSTEFSDVVDELAHYLALKEPPPPRDYSDGSYANLHKS